MKEKPEQIHRRNKVPWLWEQRWQRPEPGIQRKLSESPETENKAGPSLDPHKFKSLSKGIVKFFSEIVCELGIF